MKQDKVKYDFKAFAELGIILRAAALGIGSVCNAADACEQAQSQNKR